MKRYSLPTLLAVLLTVLLTAMAAPLSAQHVETGDGIAVEELSDTAAIDTLGRDTLRLPWPLSMQRQIDRLLEADMFQTSQLGMLVWDLDADSALYRSGERQLLRPASTEKVITAIAALDRLGGGYQFKTELCYTGEISDSTLTGDIYVVGGFDPRFNADDMKAFVDALVKMGIDTIRGHIYADRSMKDASLLGEGWCWDDDNPVLSPLVFQRKDRFMERFRSDLQEAGIVVDAFIATQEKPAGAHCIVRRFHTIDQILMKMLKESDNLYAEAMFYQIAASTGERPATAKDACAVIRRLVQKTGLDPDRYMFADGSGLSLYNYVSAELEVRLLRYAWQNKNIFLHLYPSLPIAGDDGTLSKRMRGAFTSGNVHAKTGTVTGISSLCGYCRAANGHMLAFAIINQGVMHGKNGRAFQDKVCRAMCEP